jgi:hypothetical protein
MPAPTSILLGSATKERDGNTATSVVAREGCSLLGFSALVNWSLL